MNPPAPNELEVSVFGPGYGEAIALHIGGGKWILVDSCVEPNSAVPAPLKYLHSLNVDVGNAVDLVVATHWHDDHVRGISAILAECKSAKFVISNALRYDEFLKLTALYSKSKMMSSGLDEFVHVFKLLKTRRQPGQRLGSPKWAVADRSLYRDQIQLNDETVEAEVFALSPSDDAVLQAILAFNRLWPERRIRIASPTPNYAAVVLWVKVGNRRILLGADLERTSNPKTGWSVILSDSTVISDKAGVFKIPHHGSETAHHEGVWSELLVKEPFAIVSPFQRGKRPLPSPTDVQRIVRLTPNAFATAPARRRRQKWHNRVVRDFVTKATREMRNVHHGWGHVRLVSQIDDVDQTWTIELFGDAYALKAQ